MMVRVKIWHGYVILRCIVTYHASNPCVCLNINILFGGALNSIPFHAPARQHSVPPSARGYGGALRCAGGVTTVTLPGPGHADIFTLEGDYTGDSFPSAADPGLRGLKDDAPCFAAGTRIMTPDGETPVEALRPGDSVSLWEGGTAPVMFVGVRTVDLAHMQRPELLRPVRIPAGALEDDVPNRDLLLSPDHALYLNGLLVPARDLVDGLTIRPERHLDSVRYYHVELPKHAVLVADGAPAESLHGYRGIFENAGAPRSGMAQARRKSGCCAPLVTAGEELAAIRARLYARALMRGYAVVDRPILCLKIGETLLTPAGAGGGLVTFSLPHPAARGVLFSPVFRPAETDPTSTDRRTLGVAIAELAFNAKPVPIDQSFNKADLHAPGLRETLHWTRGAARLTIPPGTTQITLRIAAWPRAWQGDERRALIK
jgi:hypothetical protein